MSSPAATLFLMLIFIESALTSRLSVSNTMSPAPLGAILMLPLVGCEDITDTLGVPLTVLSRIPSVRPSVPAVSTTFPVVTATLVAAAVPSTTNPFLTRKSFSAIHSPPYIASPIQWMFVVKSLSDPFT